MKSISKYWDAIFSGTEEAELGWHEKEFSQTFKLLQKIPDWRKATIFLTGAGTSALVDDLVSRGMSLIVNDISAEALERLRQRIPDSHHRIDFICHDIARPIQALAAQADIWIDRAALHFLTNDEDIQGYFENLRSVLKPGGYAVFAEFSTTGATKCAGLSVHRYSVDEFSNRLGSSFSLISHFDFTYINPMGGARPYIYALFKQLD